jgi:hypothetical protein
MLTSIRIKAAELRPGDLYLTDGRAVKHEVICRDDTAAANANGDPEPALELTCSDGATPILLADQIVSAERDLRPLGRVTDDDRREFAAAHAEGLHDELPREFCPECEASK